MLKNEVDAELERFFKLIENRVLEVGPGPLLGFVSAEFLERFSARDVLRLEKALGMQLIAFETRRPRKRFGLLESCVLAACFFILGMLLSGLV